MRRLALFNHQFKDFTINAPLSTFKLRIAPKCYILRQDKLNMQKVTYNGMERKGSKFDVIFQLQKWAII